MGDLHSMAAPRFADFGDFSEVFNEDTSLVMDNRSIGAVESDFSTGFLQDVFVEFSDRFKPRCPLSFPDDPIYGLDDLAMRPWNSNCTWDLSDELNCMSQTTSIDEVSGEFMNGISEEETITFSDFDPTPSPEVHQTPPREAVEIVTADYSSLSCMKNSSISDKSTTIHPLSLPVLSREMRKRKKVAYPFTVVKPGGAEEDLTLNNINERLQMPPTQPVRHPVGDFVCRPCIPTSGGQGLYGKAVVALTRIRTQGRGTITVVRTKG